MPTFLFLPFWAAFHPAHLRSWAKKRESLRQYRKGRFFIDMMSHLLEMQRFVSLKEN